MESRKKSQKTSSSKSTYFKNGEGKKSAIYKLWVVFKDEYASKYPSNPFVYYGYNKLKENGMQALVKLAGSKRSEFKVARIYENKADGKMVMQITGFTNTQQSISND